MARYNGNCGVIMIDVGVLILYIASLTVGTRSCPQSETANHLPSTAPLHNHLRADTWSCSGQTRAPLMKCPI